MLSSLKVEAVDPSLLVGLETSDDAGVYRLTDDVALVQTVDFFTPVVDDPFTFGQLAASNALSDIYAMGAEPVTCMNLLGFPIDKLSSEILNEILRGGHDKIQESGAALVGGHSLEDNEPKYGLSVTGTVSPDKVWTNSGARSGDVLILTKPLGTGIVTTAIKGELAEPHHEHSVVEAMVTLNKTAKRVLEDFNVTACTDVTGFGLLGHALEVAKASSVDIELWEENIPLLPGTQEYAEQGLIPGGTYKNLSFFNEVCSFNERISETKRLILADAITSGGLLACVPKEQINQVENVLKEAGCLAYHQVGQVKDKQEKESKILLP
ncbi:selenophosphate synthase [Natranaerobius thermophilus JW/NM-WN-LF]|uniref:Selenide, water dikinase n=2 Tax=Natranaerobius TaxID=375928 RepID=B2A1F9_NATTJ|nr:selenophosphate synthase [Natranaerobius thermophilus JW/NM-WN-LF]